jgi:hypothetical protein
MSHHSVPFMWISSLFDPHCTLIKTPHTVEARRFVAIASASFKVFRDNFDHPKSGLRYFILQLMYIY